MSGKSKQPYLIILAVTVSFILCMGPLSAGTEANTEKKPHSFFNALATQVAESNALERYDFASIALAELASSYEMTYRESANEHHQAQREKLKLARWRRGSRQFIDQINSLLSSIDSESQIEITTVVSGPIIIFIDNTPVAVSGPEIGKASQLEQRIVDQFCQLHDCDRYRKKPATPTIKVERVARGNWNLNYRQGAQYETPDGLVFIFRSLDDREIKQKQCETIAEDLRLLIASFKKAQRAGYTIDWDSVNISTLHDGTTEHITINKTDDYLRIELVFFDKYRGIDQQLLQWVRKRISNNTAQAVITDAENLVHLTRRKK